MPNYCLEGESYFIFDKIKQLTKGKKVIFDPDEISKNISFSSINTVNVFLNPNKELIGQIKTDNNIICFLDENLDQRLDYVKKLKTSYSLITYDPIPTTEFDELHKIFPKIQETTYLPSKKGSLKYKGQKQTYEWYDLNLINDIYQLQDLSLFDSIFGSNFDIWNFSDGLWSAKPDCLYQLEAITDTQIFEYYFNRIREVSKDYLEIIASKENTYQNHIQSYSNSAFSNYYRFKMVKDKLSLYKENYHLNLISYIEECLMNVREGSNPKIELLKLFLRFKNDIRK